LIENRITKEVSRDYEICEFAVGARIETVIRICFPTNGKYSVVAFARQDGAGAVFLLQEVVYSPKKWIFDVEGAPPEMRSLCRLIVGRQFIPLKCTDDLRIEPGDSCVKVLELVYRFTFRVQKEHPIVYAQESKGEQRQIIVPEMTEEMSDDGWVIAQCTLWFPSERLWHLVFWTGSIIVVTQAVVVGAGSSLPLTDEEELGLGAGLQKQS
jgi:hypothetical protein